MGRLALITSPLVTSFSSSIQCSGLQRRTTCRHSFVLARHSSPLFCSASACGPRRHPRRPFRRMHARAVTAQDGSAYAAIAKKAVAALGSTFPQMRISPRTVQRGNASADSPAQGRTAARLSFPHMPMPWIQGTTGAGAAIAVIALRRTHAFRSRFRSTPTPSIRPTAPDGCVNADIAKRTIAA